MELEVRLAVFTIAHHFTLSWSRPNLCATLHRVYVRFIQWWLCAGLEVIRPKFFINFLLILGRTSNSAGYN